MDENFSFGYWLKRQRLARDLRQPVLAAQLGVATVTLRKIEADERRPSLQLIARIAEVFALDEAERATLQRVARADLGPAALALPERAALTQPATPASSRSAPSPAADLPSGAVTFLFTDIEAAHGSGSVTPTRCEKRWPTTTCCWSKRSPRIVA
jgi:transcriptional regulator with XRE-family HTH domain